MAESPEEQPEEYPLLPHTSTIARPNTGRSTKIIIEEDETEEEEEEDIEEDRKLLAEGKRRGTSMILNDSILLLLHVAQIYCVLQALALRWTWPEKWLLAMRWVFFINLDIWEFMKLQKNGTYLSVQGHYTPSASVGIDYWIILAIWGVFILLACVAFAVVCGVLVKRKHPTVMVRIAQLQRFYVILLQAICIPFGVAIGKLFHCTDEGLVDVDNSLECYAGIHWAYIGPAVFVAVALYIIFPIWMIVLTRKEMVSMNTDRHEGYLQLKETEFVQGLDVLWIVGNFHIFSSFKKYGSFFRPSLFFLCFAVCIVYASLSSHIFAQATLITVILFLMLVAFILIRPYRVTCFNSMLIISYLCLVGDALLGSMVSNYSPTGNPNVWLNPNYMIHLLIIIQCFWLACFVVFLLYLIIRQVGCCHKFYPHPLWPSMSTAGLNKLSPETRKYVRAILRGRNLVEKVLMMPALFAPAHEVARQVKIINAYCREAEHLRDPIHDTLWDLLDELIETHEQVAPKSLFAESVKDSIRMTATELMKIMPMFARRMAQREFDFILMRPVKRRLLFKMYCLGVFLNGRRERLERQQLTLPGMQKIWTHNKSAEHYDQDDGYYEDIYPEVEEGPNHYRPVTAVSMGMLEDYDMDDDIALEEAEQWTKEHPVSRAAGRPLLFDNRAFEHDDEISAILREDTVDDNISHMMHGVPSMPLSVADRRISQLQTYSEPRPGTAGSLPGTPETRPRMTGERQTTAGSRPGSARLAAPGSRPGSARLAAPGSRPGSEGAPGSRPGSATSGRGTNIQPPDDSTGPSQMGRASNVPLDSLMNSKEDLRSSPIPGMVPDTEETSTPFPTSGESQA